MSASAYSLLHPGVQKAIFRRGWKELHAIQVKAIEEVITGQNHLLICAQTAGGKTEAAFFPIISRLAETPAPSVQALYVGPLVALINDQFQRLEALCQDMNVPVHRWHGAASATEKRKFRDHPGGILLITPESLESNFINYGKDLARLYGNLDYVVIDELHSFLSNVRGVHLRSLLLRLFQKINRRPRFIGLSATLGDPAGARQFLCHDAPEKVRIIEGKGGQNLKLGIKAYLQGNEISPNQFQTWRPSETLNQTLQLPPEQIQEVEPLGKVSIREVELLNEANGDLADIASDIVQTCKDGKNLVFGNAKRDLEALADRLHRQVKSMGMAHDPFYVHHGSLSKSAREEAEVRLKSDLPTTVLCSSTLEMGIDIGGVRRVAQVNAPWSVASMRQRLGRSGRREGESAIMRIYTRDDSPHARSTLTQLLFPDLLRAVALTRLMLCKWLEPHDAGNLNLSTLVHQILSCLRQTGGMSGSDLFTTLVVRGAFPNVKSQMFADVLTSLGANGLIEQMPQGELILAPKGEAITAHYDFYAAFQSPDEFIIRCDGREIGKLGRSYIPDVGETLILGGRRWCVDEIATASKTVFVSPSPGGSPPRFGGSAGEIHNRVAEEIRSVLKDSDEPQYIDQTGQILLKTARTMAARTGIVEHGYLVRQDSIQWYPWVGSRALRTIQLHAQIEGCEFNCDAFSITYRNMDVTRWAAHLESIRHGERDALMLAEQMPDKTFDKFDEFIADKTLDFANARDRLDMQTARNKAEEVLRDLPKHKL